MLCAHSIINWPPTILAVRTILRTSGRTFLLGYLNSDIITLGSTPVYLRNTDCGFFFRDDWKITSRLTLNLGVRYELPLPSHDKYGRWSNFDPALN